MPNFLAAENPLNHVVDAPLFHFAHQDYAWQVALHEKTKGLSEFLWSLGIGKHILIFMLAGVLTLLLFWARARQAARETVPGRFGNMIEAVMLFLKNEVARPFLGDHCDHYMPFVWGFFFFILISNLLGLIPLFDYLGHGGNTATANIGITGALALCSVTLYHFLGLKEQGNPWTYVKNLFPHVPFFVLPIIVIVELVAHVIRPCALAIRLCANMLAGHTMMAVIFMFITMSVKLGLFGWGPITLVSCSTVVALTFLELLVALIQAYVFTFLSTVFLSMAVHPEH